MDKILIKKAKKGDTHAFAQIYSQVYKKLYQHALYVLGNRSDAEDVVSDTVVEAFDNLYQLKKDEAFDVWILRILQAKCNRRLRDTYVARDTIDFEDYVENHTPENLDDLVSQMQTVINRIDLKNALSQVDPLDREIINLHVVLGYKTSEVASILEINENTVRSREARALKKLKKLMKEVI